MTPFDAEPNGAPPDFGDTDEERPGMPRRAFLARVGGTGAALGAATLGYRAVDQGVFATGTGTAYAPWADFADRSGLEALVAGAILAANAHNSQPWSFDVQPDRIDVIADRSRLLGAIDPLTRESVVSLGCAIENLALTARAEGFAPQLTYQPDRSQPDWAARITLVAAPADRSDLYRMIPDRHTNRSGYTSTRIDPGLLEDIAGLGELDGVKVRWLMGSDADRYGELLVAATETLIADPEQSAASAEWFRHSWDEIQARRDGITLDAQGMSILRTAIAKMLPAGSRERNDNYWLMALRDTQVATAAAYGIVLVPDSAATESRLIGGRTLQRIHLAATANGIALQHMNQITERADRELQLGLSPTFGDALEELSGGDALQPLVAFRVGYSNREARPSPRRAVGDVIV